jgi:preprotein translocase subunit SecA
MNSQRREVYEQRREFMKAEEVSETIADMRSEVIDAMVARRIPAKAFSEQWEAEALQEDVRTILALDVPVVAWAAEDGIDEEGLRDRIIAASDAHLAEKTANFGATR